MCNTIKSKLKIQKWQQKLHLDKIENLTVVKANCNLMSKRKNVARKRIIELLSVYICYGTTVLHVVKLCRHLVHSSLLLLLK